VKIGLYIRLLGRPGTYPPPPSWPSIREQALAAEAGGFDLVVLEDALLYGSEPDVLGVWEGVTMAAAIAASTSSIGIAQAVMNSPYRYPGRVAAIATALDEISGGRYTLGIGAGNTPDDYPRFGIKSDPRYSRFAEAIEIIHGLLKTGRMSFEGSFYSVRDAKLPLRGPSTGGPPISIAAGKPRMLRLAARFGDEWNWWTGNPGDLNELRPLVDEADRACEEIGRDPASLRRSVDVFSIVSGGSVDQAAETLRSYGSIGFDEVRCELQPAPGTSRLDAIEWMKMVVARVRTP
jgi:alkanesulfonate monooxygenase SsuD/methylene tetrahydromethanopterin reductase-like flavin-dependent oxidoreductase (luciferase family)